MDQKNKAVARNEEERFARFILVFIILEIGLLIFLLTSHLLPKSWKWGGGLPDPEAPTEELTTPGEQGTQPSAPALPVFSGGTLPTAPVFNSQTQTLGVEVASNYAMLLDTKTGEVIVAKNANTRFSPASMTKVMTLIVACENLTEDDLDRRLTMTKTVYDYARSDKYYNSSAAGFDVDDEIRIKDLLYGIGVESASDCTALIVFEICDLEAEFVALMNQKAEEMGLTNTHFDNAIGYDSENNYTTAAEMGMIFSYAMQSNLIKDILSVTSYRFEAYYDKDGVETPFGFTYYSTLFRSRMETYEKHNGKAFSLSTATLEAGKTGYLESSFLACQAKGKGNNRYILILGDATGSSAGLACYYTMRDVKYVLDTYVP